MNNDRPFVRRVLLVEDSAEILELLVLALDGPRYDLEKSSSVEEALVIWEKCGGDIDLLLTDIKLGQSGSGLDLAERLLALKPSLKVIAISGWCLPAELIVSGQSVALLHKPFVLKEVVARVGAVFRDGSALGTG